MEQLQERLDELQPKDRMDALLKLMPYVFPKLTNISHSESEPIDRRIE